jgi:hypothetical protein
VSWFDGYGDLAEPGWDAAHRHATCHSGLSRLVITALWRPARLCRSPKWTSGPAACRHGIRLCPPALVQVQVQVPVRRSSVAAFAVAP